MSELELVCVCCWKHTHTSSQKPFSTSTENHNIDTSQRNNLYLPQANLTIYQKGAYYLGIKIFDNLPLENKNVAGNQKKFKTAFKNFYTLINFAPWKSTLVNCELRTVLQNFNIAVF